MNALNRKAVELREVLDQLDACIDGILKQPGSERWLTDDQRKMLSDMQVSGKVQLERADRIAADTWNRPTQFIEESASGLDEVISEYRTLLNNLLGTLNYARAQNGLGDIREEGRETN